MATLIVIIIYGHTPTTDARNVHALTLILAYGEQNRLKITSDIYTKDKVFPSQN